VRRTYYLFQMPRWDTRLRIALDWTVSLLYRPDLTKIDLAPEREQERRNCAADGSPRSSAEWQERGEPDDGANGSRAGAHEPATLQR
jgi:hypothetical protein